MQISQFKDGTLETRIFSAPTDEQLIQRLKDEHAAALDRGAIDIRQAVMDPEQPCPCGSKRKTKNCCLKRYRSLVARAGHPVPTID